MAVERNNDLSINGLTIESLSGNAGDVLGITTGGLIIATAGGGGGGSTPIDVDQIAFGTGIGLTSSDLFTLSDTMAGKQLAANVRKVYLGDTNDAYNLTKISLNDSLGLININSNNINLNSGTFSVSSGGSVNIKAVFDGNGVTIPGGSYIILSGTSSIKGDSGLLTEEKISFNTDGAIEFKSNGVSYGNVTFTGSGLDDMSYNQCCFTGLATTTYTIVIDGVATNYSNLFGTLVSGTPQIGEVVTGSISGATGSLYSFGGSGGNRSAMILSTGTFNTNDVLTGGSSGFILNADTLLSNVDTFSIYDGVTTISGVPINVGEPQNPEAGSNVNLIFSNDNGHTLSDQWDFTITVSPLRNLLSDATNGIITIGDIDSVITPTNINIDYISSNIGINANNNTNYSYVNLGPNNVTIGGDGKILVKSDNLNGYAIIGDVEGSTYLKVDYVNDTTTLNTATFSMNGTPGVSGTFLAPTSITVVNGIITAIS